MYAADASHSLPHTLCETSPNDLPIKVTIAIEIAIRSLLLIIWSLYLVNLCQVSSKLVYVFTLNKKAFQDFL